MNMTYHDKTSSSCQAHITAIHCPFLSFSHNCPPIYCSLSEKVTQGTVDKCGSHLYWTSKVGMIGGSKSTTKVADL